jgi:hypothetical protein
MGQPKISSLDSHLAGNRTSWPTGTKSNQGPPPTYTPGQISVAPPRPAKPTGGAPGSPASGTQNSPQPFPKAVPMPTQAPALAQDGASKPGFTTITGNWEDDTKDKRQVKASPTTNICPPPQIPNPEDDLGAMPAVSGVPKMPPGAGSNHGTMNDLPHPATAHHKRQFQESSVGCLPQISSPPPPPPPPPPPMGLEPSMLPIPTSTKSWTSSAQIPLPDDDLVLFPKMSGVPNKPPVIGRIECGSLYEVQGSLRYIC